MTCTWGRGFDWGGVSTPTGRGLGSPWGRSLGRGSRWRGGGMGSTSSRGWLWGAPTRVGGSGHEGWDTEGPMGARYCPRDNPGGSGSQPSRMCVLPPPTPSNFRGPSSAPCLLQPHSWGSHSSSPPGDTGEGAGNHHPDQQQLGLRPDHRAARLPRRVSTCGDPPLRDPSAPPKIPSKEKPPPFLSRCVVVILNPWENTQRHILNTSRYPPNTSRYPTSTSSYAPNTS